MRHDLPLTKALARHRRRRTQVEAALPLTPLALLAACGGGGPAAAPPPPIAPQADSMTVPVGSAEVTGNLLTNDAVLSGVTATVTAVASQGAAAGMVGTPLQGTLGQLTVQADGSYTYATGVGAPAYAALPDGETRTDLFTYTPSTAGVAGTPTTLTLTVTGVNDAPIVAADNGGSAGPGVEMLGSVLANDRDPDTGSTLTVTSVQAGTGSTAAAEGQRSAAALPAVAGKFGTLTMQDDGRFSYTANAADSDTIALAAGSSGTEVFTYTVSDGALSRTATLTFSVVGTNEVPVAVADVASAPAASVAGNVLLNDSDADAGTALKVIGYIRTSTGGSGILGTPFGGTYGTLTLNADGSYEFVVDRTAAAVRALGAGQSATESFTYYAGDGIISSAATLTITIAGTNEAPLAVADSRSIPAGGTTSGNVLTNDSDPDGGTTLTVTGFARPNGAPGILGTPFSFGEGTLTLNADGSFSYAANTAAATALPRDLVGRNEVVYTVSDGTASSTAVLTVNVVGLNEPPMAVADTARTRENGFGALAGSVFANDRDVDAGTVLSVFRFGLEGGALAAPGSIRGTYGTLSLNSNGTYNYILDDADPDTEALQPGQTGTERFEYIVSDGIANVGSTLTISVEGSNIPGARPNIAPIASPLSLDGSRVIGAGETYLRTTGGTHPFTPGALSSSDVMSNPVNNGTVWVEVPDSGANGLTAGNMSTFTNNGLIVVQAGAGEARGMAASAWGRLVNEGQIFVRGTTGATGYITYDNGSAVWANTSLGHVNSGLIDVRASAGRAVGMQPVNGGPTVNRADGTIYVQGTEAIGVWIAEHGGSFHNVGMVEAVSTNPATPSIAVRGHFNNVVPGSSAQVLNQGSIIGDIAIKAEYYFSPAAPISETIENRGLIRGAIEQGDGNDTLINSNRIEGNVRMGNGSDLVQLDLGIAVTLGTIDGGSGNDRLLINDTVGGVRTINGLVSGGIDNFEFVELGGTANTTLALSLADVLDSGSVGTLRVDGAAGDQVDIDLSAWARGADQIGNDITYHVYTQAGATLLVDNDILVI